MTATITSIAQGFDVGARTYCFHARTSTVAAGSLWTAQSVWWFVSQAGVVVKRHHGLELIHTSTYNGEQIDLRIVDEDGTEEWATPVTTTVGSAYDVDVWLDPVGGSDGNSGLVDTLPVQTIAQANTVLRANWVTDGDHCLHIKGSVTSSSPTGGYVWNGNTTAGGSTDLDGRLTWKAWAGAASVTVSGGGGVQLSGLRGGFHTDGVDILGPYTSGGADPGSLYGINYQVNGTGGIGHNISGNDCEISGWDSAVVATSSAVAIGEMANGSFDWISFRGVTFGVSYRYHVFTDNCRYLGFSGCTWGELTGAGTGTSFRADGVTNYATFTDCTLDRTVGAWKSNVWRMRGGDNTTGVDVCQFISLHNVRVVGSTECFEFEQAGSSSSDRYYADVWLHGCEWDSGTVVGTSYMIGILPDTGFSADVVRFRIQNCSGRSNGAGNVMLRAIVHSSATTGKIHSLRLDQNTWYQEQSQGFFSRDAVFCYATGDASNFVDDSLEFVSNYAFCGDTDANSPRCFWVIPSASAKVGASDHNVLGSAGTNTTTWNDADSLATWQGATAFDDHSFEITSASHNLTNVTALSFDPEPAADGTPSASLPQVRRGFPGWGFADADRYLRDATLPDAGSHEFGSGTLMDDPTFGGGAGSYPNGQTDGFCTYS